MYELILLFLSLIFFIFQHLTSWSWDFSVYVLNAKYLFNNGYYFEWLRPPLTPFIIGIFGLMNWQLSPYFYVLFVAFLYFFSVKKFLSTFFEYKKVWFSLFFNPFILWYGMFYGTELLSLSFLLLFLCYFFKDYKKSSLFLGLSCLTRYSNLSYILLLFFYKNPRKIFVSLLIILLLFIPWLLFNWLMKGHALTSIGNFYALNVQFRKEYIYERINFLHFLILCNYLLPLFILGLVKKDRFGKKDVFFLFFLFFSLSPYFLSLTKQARYLFASSIPLIYFSIYGYKSLIKIKRTKLLNNLLFSLPILSTILLFSIFEHVKYSLPSLDNCESVSNFWVYLNYKGFVSEPLRPEIINEKIRNGYNIVIYKKTENYLFYKNLTFDKNFVVENTEDYIWLRNFSVCKKVEKVDSTYLERLKEIFPYINDNPCYYLFPSFICKLFPFL